MKIVGYNDIRDAINAMEQFQSEKPEVFRKIQQAWSLARPIKAPYSEVNRILIKSSEIGQILEEKQKEMKETLYPGEYTQFTVKKLNMGWESLKLPTF